MQIVITPLISGKPWCGATIYEQALGGSESAVVYLARELARRSHAVTVYTHGQPGNYEGVAYRPVQELQTSGIPQCEVHISSRWIEALQTSPASWKILWLHDLPHVQETTLPAHLVVCLSRFQANAWNLLPLEGKGLEIIGDGVDLPLFSGSETRDPNKLVWISNPDRGLYLASKIFVEHILPRWPEMRLHVYGRAAVYGWDARVEIPYLPPQEYLDEGWVVLHEPLHKLGLARELMRSWALFYPTYWPETFCIAGLAAQAAGTPVIASPLAGLVESVKGGILTNDFVNAVSQLRNKNRWRKLSRLGKEWATENSWAIVAAKFESAILRIMEGGLEQ